MPNTRTTHVYAGVVVDVSEELHGANGEKKQDERKHTGNAGQKRDSLHEAHNDGAQTLESGDRSKGPQSTDRPHRLEAISPFAGRR